MAVYSAVGALLTLNTVFAAPWERYGPNADPLVPNSREVLTAAFWRNGLTGCARREGNHKRRAPVADATPLRAHLMTFDFWRCAARFSTRASRPSPSHPTSLFHSHTRAHIRQLHRLLLGWLPTQHLLPRRAQRAHVLQGRRTPHLGHQQLGRLHLPPRRLAHQRLRIPLSGTKLHINKCMASTL